MPRDERCRKFKECLAGLGESEIDWHCEHCDGPDFDDRPSEEAAIVLRALESPKVRERLREILRPPINKE
jgi:hypothetical protein